MLVNNKSLIGETTYLEIQNRINEYSKDVVSIDELNSFNQHIEAKLSDFNPTLMVYGTYNAGKSSLLNALFGQEEKAKTGDSPETSKIQAYKYNGYTIYDTPGINAPIDHDKVTKEHLKKAEMILFVISNDGSLEEEYVYQRISEIVKSNKPLIIVLNNKRGIDISSKEAIDEMDKVNLNLSKIGDRNGIDKIENKVSLCMVNAKTSLKGKVEKKQLILKKSNILQLERLINQTLSDSGSKEVENTLNLYIKDFVERVISQIDQSIDNVQVRKVEELITYLEKLKMGSSVRLSNQIDKQMIRLSDELEIVFLDDEDVTESLAREYIDTNLDKISQVVESEFKKINSDLKTKINDFSVEFEKISAGYQANLPREQLKTSDSPLLPEELEGKIKDVLTSPKVVEAGTAQVLTLAKEFLPKVVMHGKGPVWISKISAKAGPLVTVAVEAFGMFSAYQEHQQMIERERSRAISAKNTAMNIADEVKVGLNGSINDNLSAVFDDLIISYKESSEKLSHSNKALLEHKNALSGLLVQYSLIGDSK